MNSTCLHRLSLVLLISITCTAGFAQTPAKDPVPDPMKSAFAKYSRNDLGGASEDLAAVQKYIDARRGAFGLRQLSDIAGWNATKAERKDGAILGAGTTMKRFYINGGKSVTAELKIDSPLVQQLAPLLTNQDIARAARFEIRRIDGK